MRQDTHHEDAHGNGRESAAPLGLVLMVQGTSSHAGKTTVVAALCRWFANAGYRVAPYKAQNMSNNAAVTADGREVGRAQAMQAVAARVPVTVDMNPVLLKPQSDRTSQVVVLGEPWITADAVDYYGRKQHLWPIVTDALDRLRAAFDVVVIEGAGSPAEINLAQYDIVNMRVARHANAPVLLVGDIERGGVFASLYGTHALLQPEERALIKAFVINKFRGDPSLLDPGFAMLEERTGVPTIGVLPWLDLRDIPEEDALEWRSATDHGNPDAPPAVLDIAVMRLPRVANLDEFQPLINEPGVRVRFVGDADSFGAPDLVIVPGTKSTLGDLAWLRERSLDACILAHRAEGGAVLGICGGLQMLGERIVDEHGVEQVGEAEGLGLLPLVTHFEARKITRRVKAQVIGAQTLFGADLRAAAPFDAYEIHMGRSTSTERGQAPLFALESAQGRSHDGSCSSDGLVVGTYLHGALEHAPLRRAMLTQLAARKGVELPASGAATSVDDALDRLATVVCSNLDMDAVFDMMGLRGTTT
ncbi:MAG TPA: cobyric acid synthase [Gemmatimonas aurantiaca]|uniref:Cobyric acid synthase n=3 Tax=Gemmatimonas aurantiaca TaxID=173480 RepID=C1A5N0_GEMAT|nr:cobyric acid synthase [Gemmatimonas aurantiaca T-27]HCT58572.1 cobyric acid synthase [Gemmatimonas aurantiaca]